MVFIRGNKHNLLKYYDWLNEEMDTQMSFINCNLAYYVNNIFISVLYHQNKKIYTTIVNQTFQLNVAVKSSIIGDDYEVSKKRKQENWLWKKTVTSAIPCNDIIACLKFELQKILAHILS